jgi:hypothetical protein
MPDKKQDFIDQKLQALNKRRGTIVDSTLGQNAKDPVQTKKIKQDDQTRKETEK